MRYLPGVLRKESGLAPAQVQSLLPRQATTCRDDLRPRLDQPTPHVEPAPQLSPVGRKDMGRRNTAALESQSQDLGVNTVCFSAVLPDAEPTAARRIDEHHIVVPSPQQIVHLSLIHI